MGKEGSAEVADRDLEVLPSIELNQSKLDAMIQFADKAEQFGKSLDKIRTFVMARAISGDWVQHGDKINVSGPGAERILSALGLMGVPISFTNWISSKDTGTDKNGNWVQWWYTADVEIGGLRLGKIEGRAGSRDLFFGFEHGKWKDLADVKETDIRMAARRGVFKEAIKVALGLRGIPADQAAILGLDVKKIKKVEYGSAKTGTGVIGAQGEFVAVVNDVVIKRQKPADKEGKGGYTIMAIKFANDIVAETFDTKIAEKAKELKGKKAFARIADAKDPKYTPNLVEIRAATKEDEKQPEPTETQEAGA